MGKIHLQIIIDNNTLIDQYYLGEPASCYYLEAGEQKILFDCGYSGAFMDNADKMGIDLSQLTHIVFSHGHIDHTGGLEHLSQRYNLNNVQIIAHPHCFCPRRENTEDIGSTFPAAKIQQLAQFYPSASPYYLNQYCCFLGQIPAFYPFEPRSVIGEYLETDVWRDDFVLDDSALACLTASGLFILTGCSHSGICNIIEYARQVFQEQRIAGIMGGFHLFETDDRLEETIRYFTDNNIQNLYPCHCVSFQAKARINQSIRIKETGSGLKLDLDL